MDEAGQIRAQMPVLGSDGGHVGTVDGLEGGRIRLTRGDDPGGAGEHRFLPLRLVAVAEAGQVRLTLRAQDARAVALGALAPPGEDDDADPAAPQGVGQVANRDSGGVGVSDMLAEEGGGSGMVHGGGTTGRGGSGLGDDKPHGGGTGGGGTTRHNHLDSGPGIPDDPNMDPGAARSPGA
jgi:hypothetical protein